MNSLHSLWQKIIPIKIELTGRWEGSYGYGSAYPEKVQTQRVGFIADLRTNGNQIEGSVKEDKNGIPEIAMIDGSFSGRKISFTKTYKSGYTIDENNNIAANDSGPAHVNYAGLYDPAEQRFSGGWTIDVTYHFKDGTQKNIVTTGTWEMKRKTS
jgi:hypothetical protein